MHGEFVGVWELKIRAGAETGGCLGVSVRMIRRWSKDMGSMLRGQELWRKKYEISSLDIVRI